MFAVFKQKLTDRISIIENGVSQDRRQERESCSTNLARGRYQRGGLASLLPHGIMYVTY